MYSRVASTATRGRGLASGFEEACSDALFSGFGELDEGIVLMDIEDASFAKSAVPNAISGVKQRRGPPGGGGFGGGRGGGGGLFFGFSGVGSLGGGWRGWR